MPARTSKAVLVRLPAELHAAVRLKATSEARTVGQAIHEALRRYVDDGEGSEQAPTPRPYTAGASFRG
jgi:predicted DNA-binding protein